MLAEKNPATWGEISKRPKGQDQANVRFTKAIFLIRRNVQVIVFLPLLMRVSANLFGIWWTTCLRQTRCSPPMWKAARTCPFRLVCLRRPLEVSRLDIMGNLKSLSSSGLTGGGGGGACCWSCCLTGRRGGMGPRGPRWCRDGTGGRSGISMSVNKAKRFAIQLLSVFINVLARGYCYFLRAELNTGIFFGRFS